MNAIKHWLFLMFWICAGVSSAEVNTNILLVSGADITVCNGTYTWNDSGANHNGGIGGFFHNDANGMIVFYHTWWGMWSMSGEDGNGGFVDYYLAGRPTGPWFCQNGGSQVAPTAEFAVENTNTNNPSASVYNGKNADSAFIYFAGFLFSLLMWGIYALGRPVF